MTLVDVRDFPPLPIAASLPPVHSRVSSIQSFQSSGLRSSTPKIPPGFEAPHAHPAPERHESLLQPTQVVAQRNISTSLAPIIPAVPLLPIGPRAGTPKSRALEALKEGNTDDLVVEKQPTQIAKAKNEASEISLGSPKQKATRSKSKIEKLDLSRDVAKAKSVEALAATETPENESKKAPVNKPGKIELPPTNISAASAPAPSVTTIPLLLDTSATPLLDSAVVGTPGTMSRPETPGTATPSEPSRTSTRPRVLRVTTGMPSKVADQTPASATTERSSFLPMSAAKRGSRRPSISSVQQSRPSTPAMSERPSHDASRASSPPPSIVGSAPERMKTKAQHKKDRKEKGRRTTEASEGASAASTPVFEEVGPVIARQKKQKKQRVESSTFASMDDTPSTKPPTGPESTEVVSEQPPTEDDTASKSDQKATAKPAVSSKKKAKATPQVPKPGTPVSETPQEEFAENHEEPKAACSLRDVLNEAARIAGPNADPAVRQAALQKLLHEQVTSMPKIISSLLQSGDVPKDHPWLNPPSFNSAAYKLPPDSRRGQDYLDGNAYGANDAFGYIYLPMKEKQALKDGNAVSVADAGDRKDDLLKRCLVTPNGWVLRHLSADESEKVLELEERRQMYVEEFGDVGLMGGLGKLEPDDQTNLGGGMEKLARNGEQHGIVWIVGEDDQIDDELFEPFDDEDGEVDGEIGTSDEEGEDEYDDAEDIDETSIGDGQLDMPGTWEQPLRAPPHVSRVGSGGRVNSLPGLGPHSRTNALRLPPHGPGIVTEQPSQTGSHSIAGPSTAAPPHVATPTTTSSMAPDNVNLRVLEADALQRRVHESQKTLDAARKEMDKLEKMAMKKVKDINRWREGLLGQRMSSSIKN